MKVKFIETVVIDGTTIKADAVSDYIIDILLDGGVVTNSSNEIFEIAKKCNLIKTTFETLTTMKVSDISVVCKQKNENNSGNVRNSVLEHIYSINYNIVSPTFEVVKVLDAETYLIVEPDTNEIFKYKLSKGVKPFKVD